MMPLVAIALLGGPPASAHEAPPPPPPLDPWSPGLAWSANVQNYSVWNLLVGHVDDDNGDGTVGSSGDVAEVLSLLPAGSVGHVVDGATGVATTLSMPADVTVAGALLANVDGAGAPEIVVGYANTSGRGVKAVRPDGTVLWTSPILTTSAVALPLAFIDVDATQGRVVQAGPYVLTAATGVLVRTLAAPGPEALEVGDLDNDGKAETFFGNTLYSNVGVSQWSTTLTVDRLATMVDADLDGKGEVVFLGAGRLVTVGHTGTVETNVSVATTGAFFADLCVADLDGDSVPEAVVVSVVGRTWTVSAFEFSGAQLWTETLGNGYSAGCAAWDFDNAGGAELALSHGSTLYIRDGATGAVLFSETVAGYVDPPVIADVNADGIGELVVRKAFDIVAYEHPDWGLSMQGWLGPGHNPLRHSDIGHPILRNWMTVIPRVNAQ